MEKRKICISVDSAADLPKELAKEHDIRSIPFTIILGEEVKLDGEVTSEEIYDYVDKNHVLPRTAAVNQFDFEKYFGNLLKSYDSIIHISLASKITSACSNAENAANTLKNVYVIDSMSYCQGIALLAIKAREFANDGDSPEEIIEKIKKLISKLQTSFLVNNLEYIYKGGRCSAASAITATLLKVRVQLTMENGKFVVTKKYVGKTNKVVHEYIENVCKNTINPDLSIVFLGKTTATDEMMDIMEKRLKEKGFKRIIKSAVGTTISTHAGPNTLGVFFLSK